MRPSLLAQALCSSLLIAALLLSVSRPLIAANARLSPDAPPLLPNVQRASPGVLISALHYWGYESSADEAVQLVNITDQPIMLDERWKLIDQANHTLAFTRTTIDPGQRIWVANNTSAFARQFGFVPTRSYSEMVGSSLTFANTGGSIRLSQTDPITFDSANSAGGMWAGGLASPQYASMERIDAGAPDAPSNWATTTATNIALDVSGNPITGTPRSLNAVAIAPTQPSTLSVVINEVAWAGTKGSFTHEWIELYNNLTQTVPLTGWQILISGAGSIPLDGVIGPQRYFLIQRYAGTFSSGALADQTYAFPALSNSGTALTLIDTQAQLADTLVYGEGLSQPGWLGAALQPYTVTQSIPAEGQVLMRKLEMHTGLPIADSDTSADWINERNDLIEGRKPIYPGWAWEKFQQPMPGAGPVTIAIAPDHSYDLVASTLARAKISIDLSSYTFDQAHLGELLAAKASDGVQVRVLLDGAPGGGLSDQTRYICQQISKSYPTSGCWFMHSNTAQNISTRYANLHAKFAIVDHRWMLIGSENFGVNGNPDDDKTDGTAGHRGVVAMLESGEIITRAQAIFAEDLNSGHHDITPWCNSALCAPFGPPSPGFTPVYTSGGVSYTVRYEPLVIQSNVPMTLATSPESHIRAQNGILALLAQAGAGDEVIMQQLDEPTYWGSSASTPEVDPNLRLQAVLGAAERGARVRLVLDGFYDIAKSARSNDATSRYLLGMRAQHGWDIQSVRGNPTALGIHNKLILARVGGQGYAQIGSWNGSETSAKRNREMSILIESNQAYDYLKRVVMGDFWQSSPTRLPLVLSRYTSNIIYHPLLSELMINPSGANEEGREWIELYNPSPNSINLSNYKIGDAAVPSSFSSEGMFLLPANTVLAAGQVLLIAQNAQAFRQDWGVTPNFELADYDPAVPDLLPYTSWATGTISLGNAGDEVVLLGPDNQVVDGVAWGTGVLPGQMSYTGVLTGGHTLQRWPHDWDTNSGTIDWRDQTIPSVGLVP